MNDEEINKKTVNGMERKLEKSQRRFPGWTRKEKWQMVRKIYTYILGFKKN